MTTHTITAALVAGLALVSEGSFAQQALERNLPAAEPGEPVSLDVAPQDFGAPDRSPLGVDLAGPGVEGPEKVCVVVTLPPLESLGCHDHVCHVF